MRGWTTVLGGVAAFVGLLVATTPRLEAAMCGDTVVDGELVRRERRDRDAVAAGDVLRRGVHVPPDADGQRDEQQRDPGEDQAEEALVYRPPQGRNSHSTSPRVATSR